MRRSDSSWPAGRVCGSASRASGGGRRQGSRPGIVLEGSGAVYGPGSRTVRLLTSPLRRPSRRRLHADRQIWPLGRRFLAGTASSIALVALAASALGGASEGRPGREISVEIVDDAGEVLTERLASGLRVAVGGLAVEATDLGPVGKSWRIVLYFDQLLATTTDFHNAALQLAERARELTDLGRVEIVLAGEGTVTALPATRDADALGQALGWIRLRETSSDRQAELRAELLRELGLSVVGAGDPAESSAAQLAPEAVAKRVLQAIAEEQELLERFHQQLLLWLADHAAPGPSALILVGSGLDGDPSRFYRQTLAGTSWGAIGESLPMVAIEPAIARLAQAGAVYGWTVIPYLSGRRGDALLEETEEQIAAREEAKRTDVIFQDGRLVDRTTVGLDPVELLERRRKREAERSALPLLIRPEEVLQELAAATGGELVTGQLQLAGLLARLPRWRRLQLDIETEPRPGLQPLAVTSNPDRVVGWPASARVRLPAWVADSTPEVVSEARARQVLIGELDEGELAISAAVQQADEGGESRLVVKRDSLLTPGEDQGPVRITVAAAREDGAVEIDHFDREGWPIAGPVDDGSQQPTLEVSLRGTYREAVVVLVEELATGRWGASFASTLEAVMMRPAADDYDALLLPAPKTIHLMAPAQGFAMGPTSFDTVVSRGDVARVDFLLDGEREVESRSAPFAAILDLGPLPQPRRVEVVAYDGQGREIGRDYLIVNEGSGVFGVRIVSPRPDLRPGPKRLLTGAIDVEAEVEPRRGTGVDRVEFFWKERKVATRYARPYRQRIVIPADDATGFIRVVAYLDDGASSEDVVFINSPGPSERLQVNLMELYVVVTDRRGRPVEDLPRELFRVREQGELQEIATFSDAGDLPLTVGMVIDSSASMFVKLPEVQFAAAEFLRGLVTRKDRAFVVGFGSEPRMTLATTSDLPTVIRSIDRLRPDGQTAIWKAIVYSLVQLQGVPGKKALVVYTDGADEDPDFSFRTCLKFARRVGVPIYVILSNNEIVRTEGKGLNVRGFLERLESLTGAVGGRVFFARVGEDLDAVYRMIDRELRSQYVIGFYSTDTGGREWRSVEVDVARAGYSARTIAGYFR